MRSLKYISVVASGLLVACGNGSFLSGITGGDSNQNNSDGDNQIQEINQNYEQNADGTYKNWDYRFDTETASYALSSDKAKDGAKVSEEARKNSEDARAEDEELEKEATHSCNGGQNVIKVNGSEKVYDASPDASYLLRITGNSNVANITMGAVASSASLALADGEPIGADQPDVPKLEDGDQKPDVPKDNVAGSDDEQKAKDEKAAAPKVEGICIFIAGNESVVNIKMVKANTDKITVIGRGNAPTLNVEVDGDSKLGSLDYNFKGNNGSITMKGDGEFGCEAKEDDQYKVTCE